MGECAGNNRPYRKGLIDQWRTQLMKNVMAGSEFSLTTYPRHELAFIVDYL